MLVLQVGQRTALKTSCRGKKSDFAALIECDRRKAQVVSIS